VRPALSLMGLVMAWMGCGTAVRAEFVTPSASAWGWTRGTTPWSAYAEWDRFTSTGGPNMPDVGSFVGGAFSTDASPWNAFDRRRGSFVTGSGNIYSIGQVVAPQVDIPSFGLGPNFSTTIVLQVRTQGSEIDPASVLLNGLGPTLVMELYRMPLGGAGGAVVDMLYRFNIEGNSAGYVVRFQSLSSSMSLDRIAVDAFTAIPTPGTGAVVVLAATVLLRRRRLER
jgi:uncharacterized protein (TIGR03382 family)